MGSYADALVVPARMARAIPFLEFPNEIIYMISSLLTAKQARAFRRTCKGVKAVADGFAFPELTFNLFHHDDFDMLRHFANHPVFAGRVQSLVYVTKILDPRALFYIDFIAQKKHSCYTEVPSYMHSNTSRYEVGAKPSMTSPCWQNIYSQHNKSAYNKYIKAQNIQAGFLENNQDISVLRDVVPKFVSLRHITVSAGNQFRSDSISTPSIQLSPQALRQTSSVLLPLLELGRKLKSLCLGDVHWSGLARLLEDESIIGKSAHMCANLTTFKLVVETRSEGSVDPDDVDARQCKATMRKGNLRRLLKSMEHLESLVIRFTHIKMGADLDGDEYPAALSHLVPSGMHWHNLQDLWLENVEAPRKRLTAFIRLHAGTLRTIRLSSTRLIESSWHEFVADLRKLAKETTSLAEISLEGEVVGESEEPDMAEEHVEELYDFGSADDIGALGREISNYIMGRNVSNPMDFIEEL